MKNNIYVRALMLTQYILSHINKFETVTQRTPYYHMGATITDSILQSGLNYKNVVYPRVYKLLTEYSDYKTTSDFIILMQTVPLKTLLKWNNEEKLIRIDKLTLFLFKEGIENEDSLATWLGYHNNVSDLLSLRGVGPKTVDYLKMLSGNQAIAIDRHLFKFLELAGIFVSSYNDANLIFSETAKLLQITKYELDRKIWLFMSNKTSNRAFEK